MRERVIKILDFTEYPGPRYISQGLYSGEEFYNDVLNNAFNESIINDYIIIVDLDNTAGYAPSFIDEVFGNLIYDFHWNEIKKRLKIKSDDEPDWKEIINEEVFPQWLKKRKADEPRKPEGF